MEDSRIVELYWERSQQAISESVEKYGSYLDRIAYNILFDREDAEECVSDTWLDAWNAMPPHRPSVLSAFLGKITRRISIDRWRRKHAEKRGGGELMLALEELADCVSGKDDVQDELQRRELTERLQAFLDALPVTERRVFLCRYWYVEPVRSIALRFGFSESKVTSMLYRTRQKLRTQLEQEAME